MPAIYYFISHWSDSAAQIERTETEFIRFKENVMDRVEAELQNLNYFSGKWSRTRHSVKGKIRSNGWTDHILGWLRDQVDEERRKGLSDDELEVWLQNLEWDMGAIPKDYRRKPRS